VLSGLVKAEQYGKNLAVEVSVINFAPLTSGEYFCLLSDGNGQTEILPLRGKSIFNILSDVDISKGFCAVVCFVKNDVVPVAYGVNGDRQYDWKSILNATLPPLFKKNAESISASKTTETAVAETKITQEPFESVPSAIEERAIAYNDETVAEENYYKESENEQELFGKAGGNAQAKSANTSEREKARTVPAENGNADGVLRPFKTESDGYYLSVKAEMDALLKKYPKDGTLKNAFSCSEWVRVKGDKKRPEYLVGVVYDDGKAKYVCYALRAENRFRPPEEIKDVCAFVPVSPYEENSGFFVIFQSAATGECIKPSSV
jgi:hypothetical protein